MNSLKFTIRSFSHYLSRNILLVIGFAISTAVLTGALIVGDSVKYSLSSIVDHRLGSVNMIMRTGDRYFTGELADSIRISGFEPLSALLVSEGTASARGGEMRLSNIQVLGVDPYFDEMAGTEDLYASLEKDSIIISHNMAERMNLKKGDEFLLRMNRLSLIPLNAPFVSDANNELSLRLTVKHVATSDELGTFNIRNSQRTPFNIFISADYLQEQMELDSYFNLLLSGGEDKSIEEFEKLVSSSLKLQDAGLYLERIESDFFYLKSDRVFFDDSISTLVESAELRAQPYISYFVNSISTGEYSTPYSFISTVADSVLGPDEIIINNWLAEDLAASIDDTLGISYFTVGPLRELSTSSAEFILKEIVPTGTKYGDAQLMPDIPGMSDAGNCRDWEAGVPITLDSIRDKDEDYWTAYKGTPKAFISLSTAKRMWSNRFGTYTSFRFYGITEQELEHQLIAQLEPGTLGFEFIPSKSEGRFAAANGVDFSELFGGLSFFLLLGAILLSVLLLKLNIEDRREQVLTLSAMGIPAKRVRRLLLNENIILASIGALLGIFLAIGYNKLIFNALNGIWMDIIRTSMLEVSVQFSSLLLGFLISLAVAWLLLYFILNRFVRDAAGRHRTPGSGSKVSLSKLHLRLILYVLLLAPLVLIALQFIKKEVVNAGIFFISGGMLLAAGILWSYLYLKSASGVERVNLTPAILSRKNAVSNISRSMSVIILLAFGTFIVISTGSNKKDLFTNSTDLSSGTGGFLYYGENSIPLLENLNKEQVRYDYGFTEDFKVIQLRLAEGDDASCLNLNLITKPRILGVNPAALEGRFSFVTKTDFLNEELPWSSLSDKLDEGLIPAIADETVIKWGLGTKVGDTLKYQDARGNQLQLLLVGGLAPSIFQGSVLISDKNFLEHFPSSSGSEVFLVDGAVADTAAISNDLLLGLRNTGLSLDYAPARLVEFYSVTNTYLSIFMILGALGLLLGTFGLAMVLSRSILERKSELSILLALGIGMKTIRQIIAREYLLLLLSGTLIGTLSAIISTLPAFLNKHADTSPLLVMLMVAAILINGMLWIFLSTHLSLKNKSLVVSLRDE